jgi:hypothetical protein
MKYIFCLLLFIVSLNAYSGENYTCEITGAFQIDQEGKQITTKLKKFVGDSFSVNRTTGEMSGALINSFASGPTVVNPGSEDSSFQAVNSMINPVTTATNFNTLVIQEFVEGKNKPFVFLDDGVDIFYGKCVHH